jgi:hypothetical protein
MLHVENLSCHLRSDEPNPGGVLQVLAADGNLDIGSALRAVGKHASHTRPRWRHALAGNQASKPPKSQPEDAYRVHVLQIAYREPAALATVAHIVRRLPLDAQI